MTANRPRRSVRPEDSPFADSFYAGLYPSGSRWLVGRHARVWRPPTDVYETEHFIVVQLEVAGMRRDDFYITLEDRRLVISGIRSHNPSNPDSYHQLEVNYGEFRSEVELSVPVDTDHIESGYEDGFLRITLPKAHPRRVEIR